MKVVFESGQGLKKLIKTVSKFASEVVIKATTEEIRLQAIDTAKIAMIDILIPRDATQKLGVEDEETVKIKVADLLDALKRAKNSETVTLATSGERMIVTLEGRAKRKFVFPLYERGGETRPAPNVGYTATARVPGDVISTALKEAETVAEYVTLRIDTDGLYITAKGTLSEYAFEVNKDTLLDLSISEPATANYAIDYLIDFVSGVSAFMPVQISLKNDSPLKMTYNIEGCTLTLYLAPRIET